MGTIFKVGDRVFDIRFGWGIVNFTYSMDWNKAQPEFLVCEVEFDKNKNKKPYSYTKKLATQMLSFTEYTLQGFSQERSMNYNDYIGKWGKFWDNDKNHIILDKLDSYIDNIFEDCFFKSKNSCYKNFEPLTEEQIKILNLE